MDWIVITVGLIGFYLAGKKLWWSWYVNLGCQALWFIYGWTTEEYAFVASSLIYSVIFGKNAYSWTKEHREENRKNEEANRKALEEMKRYARQDALYTEQLMQIGRVRVVEDEYGIHAERIEQSHAKKPMTLDELGQRFTFTKDENGKTVVVDKDACAVCGYDYEAMQHHSDGGHNFVKFEL